MNTAAISKINGKLKKRAITNNLVNIQQQSSSTNPNREKANAAAEKEGSIEPVSTYNLNVNAIRSTANNNNKGRDNSEGTRDGNYMSTNFIN